MNLVADSGCHFLRLAADRTCATARTYNTFGDNSFAAPGAEESISTRLMLSAEYASARPANNGVEQSTVLLTTQHQLQTFQVATENISVCA